MTITEFADIIDKHLVFTRYANQKGRMIAQFERAEIKEGNILQSKYGEGLTTDEALKNYVANIKGKRLVFDATSPEYRQEFVVPKSITIN